jgi:hypothetical protein
MVNLFLGYSFLVFLSSSIIVYLHASLTILCFAILSAVFLSYLFLEIHTISFLFILFPVCYPLPLLPLPLLSSSLPIFLQYFNHTMPSTILHLPCEQFSLPSKNSSLFILVLLPSSSIPVIFLCYIIFDYLLPWLSSSLTFSSWEFLFFA